MTIPNMMTLARIALVPGFLIGVIYGQLQIALVLFLLAALTDVLDGYLARCLRQESPLGSYLDPLADKLLSTVAFVSLAAIGLLPAWLAVVVFFKDLFIALGVAIIFLVGKKPEVVPSVWGKGTTFVQIATVACALLWELAGLDGARLAALFWLAGIMTVFSAGYYIQQGFRQLRDNHNMPASA